MNLIYPFEQRNSSQAESLEAVQTPPVESDSSPSLLDRVRNGTWLDAQEFPPLQWAVQGVIPEGYGLLIGPPKLGKSWFVLGVMLAVAEGGFALARIPVKQRPVLYLALEDGHRRLQSRSHHLTAGDPLPPSFDYVIGGQDGEHPPIPPADVLPTISAWMDAHPGGVVALDTLGKILPPARQGQGAYERDYEIGSRLKAIVDAHPGSTLLVVHHTRKMDATDFMDATSGTNGLNGAADFTILLKRERGSDEARILLSGRDVQENEYLASMPGGAWQLEGDSLEESANLAHTAKVEAGLGEDQRALLDFVNSHPEGVTAQNVATHMGWDGEAGTGKARNYLRRLYKTGRVSKAGRGTYTPQNIGVPSVPSVPNTQDPTTKSTHGTQGTHRLDTDVLFRDGDSSQEKPSSLNPPPATLAYCDQCGAEASSLAHGLGCSVEGCTGTCYRKEVPA